MDKNKLITFTKKAGQNLSKHQYLPVRLKDDKVIKAKWRFWFRRRGQIVGILQNTPKKGEDAIVGVSGVSKMIIPDYAASFRVLFSRFQPTKGE